MGDRLRIEWLGRTPYAEALERQRRCVDARREGATGDLLLLLEHPPVITCGRRADPAHLRLSKRELSARGLEVHSVSRGGDVTYHGPGQLVGYPIVDLAAREAKDVLAFLRGIEQALVAALASLGIGAGTREGRTGVFVGAPPARAAGPARDRKIASIGIGVRRWISYHGFALNVTNDLAEFEAIIPCGLHDVDMTSVARELGPRAPADLALRAREAVSEAFARWLA